MIKIDCSSKKMFQLTQFIEKYHKNEKIILVPNTHEREDPNGNWIEHGSKLKRRGRRSS